MYALKVTLNNEPSIVGGTEDLCVLSATLTGTGRLGSQTHRSRDDETQDFTFRLGGLTSRGPGATDEHLEWLSLWELKVGDKVTVEIIETDTADPVISGKEAEQRAQDERAYFEHCKRAYFELKAKYEPES